MKKESRIYVIGAGLAGIEIAKEIQDKNFPGQITAFLDDDQSKIGNEINSIPVLGPIKSCAGILKVEPTDEAIIAIPAARTDQIKNIYGYLQDAGFSRIRILPTISQIVNGHPHLVQARDIDPQDLLGRTPISINLKESLSYLRGKRVLVTGAGGSIGSELSRQLLSAGASRLYLFGHGENSIYRIEQELRLLQDGGVGEKTVIIPIIGDLQDRDYMFFIMNRLKADVVFHCAAHKHVPMMELNPVEAVKNNIFGTLNLVEASEDSRISRFVLISTDKAVNPASIYGITKKMAELIVLKERSKGSNFMVVRFGNVLGSRGSIVPLFKKQILSGGPLTVTHKDINRYFMTIPEASSLVLQTGGRGDDGGLYLLDMGEPIRIMDIANQMIAFYGFNPSEIPIEITGLRPGEKLEERLWSEHETPVKTDFSRILRLETHNGVLEINKIIEKIKPVCFYDEELKSQYRNKKYLRDILKKDFPHLKVSQDEPEY